MNYLSTYKFYNTQYQYPHNIDNGHGEKITFLRLVKDLAGNWLETEGHALPMAGPPMHVHFKQDEGFTVVKGKIATQVFGEEPKFAREGESVVFKAGTPHKFWNPGTEPLHIKGWINPANNVEYFLTELYDSTAANDGKRPSTFDGAWLMNHFRSEFDMVELPGFVKKVIFPIALFFGKLMGKDRKFAGAPKPM